MEGGGTDHFALSSWLRVTLLAVALAGPLFAMPEPTEGDCGEAVADEASSKLAKRALRQAAEDLKSLLLTPDTGRLAASVGAEPTEVGEALGGLEETLDRLRDEFPRQWEMAKNRLVRAFVAECKRYGRIATLDEVALGLGLAPGALRALVGDHGLFRSSQELKSVAMRKHPTAFNHVIDTDIFNAERTEKLVEAIKRRRRLVLTTAVAGARVDRQYFEALRNYAKKRDAEIIVYPANMRTNELDPILLDTPGVHVLTNSVELTPWINLNRIKLIAKQINPLMGLERIGKRGQSQIVGSPKMHLKTLPTMDNSLYPHRLLTTGAVTEPSYQGRLYIQGRTDEIAAHDHVLGAVILEKTNGGGGVVSLGTAGAFHMRHVEYVPEAGGFMDLGRLYTRDAVRRGSIEALVMGDVHVGSTDQRLMATLRDQILRLRPKYVVLHDLLNGHSISHHDRQRIVTMAQKAKRGEIDLEEELNHVVAFVNALFSVDKSLKVVVVPSNHDFWLHRWLQDGQFMREPQNTRVGLELAQAYSRGEDPFRHALLTRGVEYPKRLIFLETGSSFKVGPEHRLVELAQHGHMGANGGRGSLRSMRTGYDRIVFGHTHTYARLNGSVNVGTFTDLVLPYNREGFSNWVQSLALVGEHGEIQVLEFQDGEWYADPDQEPLPPEAFFLPGYPAVAPNNGEPAAGGQIDQYGGE